MMKRRTVVRHATASRTLRQFVLQVEQSSIGPEAFQQSVDAVLSAPATSAAFEPQYGSHAGGFGERIRAVRH
jgi:hypothetical protein